MVSTDNGTMDITGSVLSNNTYGAVAVRGGVTSISNSTIESNTIGANVRKGGTISLTNVLPDGSAAPAGVQVTANGTGANVRAGGLLEVSSARIASNTGDGLYAQLWSAISFTDSGSTITGNRRGIACATNVSYTLAGTSPGSVTGNLAGDVATCSAEFNVR